MNSHSAQIDSNWLPNAARYSKMKVLVIDDEPANVALLEGMLDEGGYSRIKSITDSRLAFETNRVQIHQFLGVRTEDGGRSGIPLRPWWDQLREVRSPALDEHGRRSRIAASR